MSTPIAVNSGFRAHPPQNTPHTGFRPHNEGQPSASPVISAAPAQPPPQSAAASYFGQEAKLNFAVRASAANQEEIEALKARVRALEDAASFANLEGSPLKTALDALKPIEGER